MSKFFTLIELIVVIVVLGLLAAIVTPNISSWQREAETTAVVSNLKNLQTSVDLYTLKNDGKLPTEEQPTEFIPQPIVMEEIYPEQLRSLPKTKGILYWVDVWGNVWSSSIDAPTIESTEGHKLTWKKVEGASKYRVYQVSGYIGTENLISGKASKTSLKFVTEVSELQTDKVKEGQAYVVSAVDKNGFESAPSGAGYTGYSNKDSYVENETPSEREEVVQEVNIQGNWIPDNPNPIGIEAVDNDEQTYTTLYSGSSYVTWTPDLSGYVIEVVATGGNKSGPGYDYNGQLKLEVLNANNGVISTMYITSPANSPIKTSFIMPPNAKQIKFTVPTSKDYGFLPARVYSIKDASDKTPPPSVFNLSYSATDTGITLNWKNPSVNDLSRIEVFKDNVLLTKTTEQTFVDKPLYSNSEHTYKFIAYDNTGNKSSEKTITAKTLKRDTGVDWKGLDAIVFDKDTSTFKRVNNTLASSGRDIITWDGDLKGKKIRITSTGTYIKTANSIASASLSYRLLDANNKVLSTVSFSGSTVSTKEMTVPENAVKLKIEGMFYSGQWLEADIYEIAEVME